MRFGGDDGGEGEGLGCIDEGGESIGKGESCLDCAVYNIIDDEIGR